LICEGKGCKEEPDVSVRYDCGVGLDQVLLLCEKHYNSNEVFRKHIKKIEKIK